MQNEPGSGKRSERDNESRARAVRRGARWLGAMGLLVVTSMAVAWALNADAPELVMGEGRLVAATDTVAVRPARVGIIRAIHVEEGDLVSLGEIVAELAIVRPEDESAQDPEELAAARLKLSRLEAELDFLEDETTTFEAPDGTDPLAAALHWELFENATEKYRLAISLSDQEAAETDFESNAVEAEIDQFKRLVPLRRERVSTLSKLLREDKATKLDVLAVEDQLVEAERELAVSRQRSKGLKVRRQTIAHRKEAFRKAWRGERLAGIAEVRETLARLEGKPRTADEQEEELISIIAPRDGRVKRLDSALIGQFVEPAQRLMSIETADRALEVETWIRSKDIASVREGQRARITSFDQSVSIAVGWVRYVSTEPVVREGGTDTAPGIYYPIRITLPGLTAADVEDMDSISASDPLRVEIEGEDTSVVKQFFGKLLPLSS